MDTAERGMADLPGFDPRDADIAMSTIDTFDPLDRTWRSGLWRAVTSDLAAVWTARIASVLLWAFVASADRPDPRPGRGGRVPRRPQRVCSGPNIWVSVQSALWAISIILVVGILLGFAMGRWWQVRYFFTDLGDGGHRPARVHLGPAGSDVVGLRRHRPDLRRLRVRDADADRQHATGGAGGRRRPPEDVDRVQGARHAAVPPPRAADDERVHHRRASGLQPLRPGARSCWSSSSAARRESVSRPPTGTTPAASPGMMAWGFVMLRDHRRGRQAHHGAGPAAHARAGAPRAPLDAVGRRALRRHLARGHVRLADAPMTATRARSTSSRTRTVA